MIFPTATFAWILPWKQCGNPSDVCKCRYLLWVNPGQLRDSPWLGEGTNRVNPPQNELAAEYLKTTRTQILAITWHFVATNRKRFQSSCILKHRTWINEYLILTYSALLTNVTSCPAVFPPSISSTMAAFSSDTMLWWLVVRRRGNTGWQVMPLTRKRWPSGMVVEKSSGFGMVVKKGQETFVYAILPLGMSHTKISQMHKNLCLNFY